MRKTRLVLSLLLVVRDVEELDLVTLLGGGNDTEPVTELLLAQMLLGQVLEVALGEGNVGVDPDLALTCNERNEKSAEVGNRGRESLSQLSPTRMCAMRPSSEGCKREREEWKVDDGGEASMQDD